MSEKSENRDEGFTLIEVLVALAIIAITMGVLLSVISDDLHRVGEGEAESNATAYIQSLLAEAGADVPLRPGDTQGDYADGMHWRLHAEPFGSAEDRQAWIADAYRLTAIVSWSDHGRVKSISLTGLRLAPEASVR